MIGLKISPLSRMSSDRPSTRLSITYGKIGSSSKSTTLHSSIGKLGKKSNYFLKCPVSGSSIHPYITYGHITSAQVQSQQHRIHPLCIMVRHHGYGSTYTDQGERLAPKNIDGMSSVHSSIHLSITYGHMSQVQSQHQTIHPLCMTVRHYGHGIDPTMIGCIVLCK